MRTDVRTIPSGMTYFPAVVGLRFYLALWVAVSHALRLSGVRPTNIVVAQLMDGRAAVMVFMIISGFVITNLLLAKREPYAQYIVRRFFRLYPAYVVCCIAGYLTGDAWVSLVQGVPWHDEPGWAGYAQLVLALVGEARDHFWAHFAVHATMLHGAVPGELLEYSALTFLSVAWSISLEWQFYLAAPLLLAVVARPNWLLVAIPVAALAYLLVSGNHIAHFGNYAFLPATIHYFAIGIVSRLAYRTFAAYRVSPLLVALIGVFGALALLEDPVPIVLWLTVYAYLVWGPRAPVTANVFRMLFTTKFIIGLGEASYSLYLVHRPVQIALGALAVEVMTLNHVTMLAVQLSAITLSVVLSIVLYRWVERPGMNVGRRVAARVTQNFRRESCAGTAAEMPGRSN